MTSLLYFSEFRIEFLGAGNVQRCRVSFSVSLSRLDYLITVMNSGSTKPIPDLNRACASMPVHIIFGNINDRLPRSVHDALVDPQSGRQFASVTRIKGSGHLVSIL